MELTDITQELLDGSNRLKSASKELYKLAREKAEAEREYRIALHHSIIGYKNAGEKVTLISDLARGETADAKFARDLADVRFTAGREALDAIRVQMSALQTILKYQTEV